MRSFPNTGATGWPPARRAAGCCCCPTARSPRRPRRAKTGCRGTIWAAARDSGWVVGGNAQAVAAIGSLLTGQYDGILGVARLEHLQKAFAMLPAFSLPIAAVPFQQCHPAPGSSCAAVTAAGGIDVEWVLGMLGVAGGGSAPVADYLPLLRESAEMFAPQALVDLADSLGLGGRLGRGVESPPAEARVPPPTPEARVPPLDATALMAGEFLARGGKFLRPFICLAAFDAVRADLGTTAAGSTDGVAFAARRRAAKAASVAVEIFHKASLVHDDIEDDDLMRYGRPALHVQRGVAAAVNVGDYMQGLGYRIVSGLPDIDPAMHRDLLRILSDAHVRLAQGQGAELWWRDAADKLLAPEESLEIYSLKTSPAFEAAVGMGIRLAGVNPADVGAIDRYARHVGTGFQVLNDLKDWSGDLLGGRPTLMWALALERLGPAEAGRLRTLAASAADADEANVAAAIAEARRLYESADVFSRAAEIVARERAAAAAAAATCRLPRLREVLEFLLDLAVPEQASSSFVG
ncbi:MAG: polyprenyl synthetase family protein [Planctomycetia bacterium]|nr:polyprenyl synthetase family protein [Planctomycetia bacterium]